MADFIQLTYRKIRTSRHRDADEYTATVISMNGFNGIAGRGQMRQDAYDDLIGKVPSIAGAYVVDETRDYNMAVRTIQYADPSPTFTRNRFSGLRLRLVDKVT